MVNRFDREAATYDARAGIPAEKRSEIVRALVKLARLTPGDRVLELGAGTGQLGARFPAQGVQYIGLDASAPMLELFQRRLPVGDRSIRLIHADADADWPVSSRSVRAVFSSRAIHLFELEHVVSEALRITFGPAARTCR